MRLFRSFNITLGTLIQVIGILVCIALIVTYVQFQARNILLGPTLTLTDNYEVVQHTETVTLSGTAENIVKLELNGREIHTNEMGDFTETLVLQEGYTIIELSAQDRFGRTTSLTREYVYVPLST